MYKHRRSYRMEMPHGHVGGTPEFRMYSVHPFGRCQTFDAYLLATI